MSQKLFNFNSNPTDTKPMYLGEFSEAVKIDRHSIKKTIVSSLREHLTAPPKCYEVSERDLNQLYCHVFSCSTKEQQFCCYSSFIYIILVDTVYLWPAIFHSIILNFPKGTPAGLIKCYLSICKLNSKNTFNKNANQYIHTLLPYTLLYFAAVKTMNSPTVGRWKTYYFLKLLHIWSCLLCVRVNKVNV